MNSTFCSRKLFCIVLISLCSINSHHIALGGEFAQVQAFCWHPFDWKRSLSVSHYVVILTMQISRQTKVSYLHHLITVNSEISNQISLNLWGWRILFCKCLTKLLTGNFWRQDHGVQNPLWINMSFLQQLVGQIPKDLLLTTPTNIIFPSYFLGQLEAQGTI